MKKFWLAFITIAAVLGSWSGSMHGYPIPVPNGSFESPATPYVSINIDSWQKTAKPDDYVESGGFGWTNLTGIFQNTPTNSPDHIDNCDGNQAMWLFADPKVGVFQDYDSLGSRDTAPTHAFNVKFEVWKAYHLTVGIIGTGGNMMLGASLELSLYYRDAASNMVTVAATSITNSSDIFSNNTHLIDFTVNVPTVQPGDAWANQNIGILLLSTVTTNLQGGYWDLDNVRLNAEVTPVLRDPIWTNGQIQFTLQSEPGLAFEILANPDLTTPVADWSSLGRLTNTTGMALFTDTNLILNQRFYRARQLP